VCAGPGRGPCRPPLRQRLTVARVACCLLAILSTVATGQAARGYYAMLRAQYVFSHASRGLQYRVYFRRRLRQAGCASIHSHVLLPVGAKRMQSARFQAQPLVRAHWSTPKCPPCTLHRLAARLRVPVAAVRPRPLQHLQVSALRHLTARALVLVAAVRPQPLQYSHVPAPHRRHARVLVPFRAVGPPPLKHSEVPACRRRTARPLVQIAAVRPQPRSTSRCQPCAASRHVYSFQSQPLDRAHFSTARCPPPAAAMHVCTRSAAVSCVEFLA
jgi:hypothetical protein